MKLAPSQINAHGAGAMHIPGSSIHVALLIIAAKNRLPAVYGLRDFVVAGGLMAYGFDSVWMYRRAADYVDKILKGAKPAELPIEQVSRHLLVVNLKTAKALRLNFPESILVRADEVIR